VRQEPSSRSLLSVHKSKSYEERELEYNEARSRIFNTESVSLCNLADKYVRTSLQSISIRALANVQFCALCSEMR